MSSTDALPEDAESLKRLLLAREAELAVLRARATEDDALIAHLRLQIEKMRRERFGQRSERSARLLDQFELQLEDLEASATEDELAAERAATRTTGVLAFTRKRPARKPFPEHLPRERVIVPGPTACSCCGGTRLSKLGEDVTETLEVIPRQWKVIQHVREKFSCRDCETIDQAPAPFHVVPRGWAGGWRRPAANGWSSPSGCAAPARLRDRQGRPRCSGRRGPPILPGEPRAAGCRPPIRHWSGRTAARGHGERGSPRSTPSSRL